MKLPIGMLAPAISGRLYCSVGSAQEFRMHQLEVSRGERLRRSSRLRLRQFGVKLGSPRQTKTFGLLPRLLLKYALRRIEPGLTRWRPISRLDNRKERLQLTTRPRATGGAP